MSLAAQQRHFMAQVLEEGHPLPPGWSERMGQGLNIYRNAYRSRHIEALRETFPKTAQWSGEESFVQAAAHHLITRPPCGWTLDLVGEGFVATLEGLFARDPDVADLAWLEWAMHLAYTARDDAGMDVAAFAEATASFGEDDWQGLRLAFSPSLHLRVTGTDCAALWQALARDDSPQVMPVLDAPHCCLVWREGFDPVFRMTPHGEGLCLAMMREGGTFGEVCELLARNRPPEDAANSAGAMLGQWLAAGLILSTSP